MKTNYKELFLLVLFYILQFYPLVNAQNAVLPIVQCNKDSNCVKGIYANFEEFRMNKPSILVDSFVIEGETTDARQFTGSNKMKVYYYASDGTNKWLGIKNWGFSDGKRVFIKNRTQYFELIINDKYASFCHSNYTPEKYTQTNYFTGTTKTVSPAEESKSTLYGPFAETRYRPETNRRKFYYLYLSSGDRELITKGFVKNLIRGSESLYQQFNNDPINKFRLPEYIDAYFKGIKNFE